jgi:phytoene synthase
VPAEEPRSEDELSDEARLALGYTPAHLRERFQTVLQLDRRLARILAATTETMLGQLRLAWWREALGQDPQERPRGDLVLDAVGKHLSGREASLVRLVDGWEHLLKDACLQPEDAQAFADGRGAAIASVFAEIPGANKEQAGALVRAARCWALADLAANVSAVSERDMLVSLGLAAGAGRTGLRREARGVAVLGALGQRSLRRGGKPLMEGRSAALTAMRAGLLGR